MLNKQGLYMSSSKLAMLIVVISSIITIGYCSRETGGAMLYTQLHSLDTVTSLFPTSGDHVTKVTDEYIESIKKEIESLLAIPADQRTFANTALALDDLFSLSDNAIKIGPMEAMRYVHPDESIREAACKA